MSDSEKSTQEPEAGRRTSVIHEGLPTQLPDIDPEETGDWLESFDALVQDRGRDRARYLMLRLLERAREKQIGVPALRSTDYINTIPPEREPWFPGDEDIERRIRAFIRWNAAVMVSDANRPGLEVGGHIATYQSAASLYEVGFNHFFRGKEHPGGGDQVYIQGHGSPGIYARAYLEGRLTEDQLMRFRQEVQHGVGKGLPSYPHPRLMPEFWEFPTVSMGLTAIGSIYQARFNRYLQNRGIKDTSEQHVWAFLGDGEMAEPESLGAIGVAAREELDNLTWVINCNLQQLDGPVRGNGKIIQELEAQFRGAGWNVVKVIWGREWDALLARDVDGVLVNQMNSTPDGQFQTYSVEDGAYNREQFFGADPRLRKMVEHMTDRQIEKLPRGGHDYRKVYAAFDAAAKHVGQPTVILAHTVKGWTIESLEGRNATHQMKKLKTDDFKKFRDRLYLPMSDKDIDDAYEANGGAPFFHPGTDSPEIEYMMERRKQLGGPLPKRVVRAKPVKVPDPELYDELKQGSGKSKIATTMAVVRLLRDWMKDKEIGPRIVPIAPDEYRTFGMDSMFPSAKVYNPGGQRYESVDRKLLLKWREATDGQLLHEGISEAGAMASAIAAGSSYATHGQVMIPFYIFYSMFGFQRTGDSIWAMADQLARGFLIGATAGRTTLTGEGLQHADGHSPLLAATNPAVVHYDPAFAHEVAHIMEDGLRRMYTVSDEHPHGEDVIFYITVYNEPMVQPKEPDNIDKEGLLKGIYHYADAPEVSGNGDAPRIQLFASGVGFPWIQKAQKLLADDWGVAADLWSVTSWNELARDAIEAEKWTLNHPGEKAKVPFITSRLEDVTGPVVAVSDYMRAVPLQIAHWMPSNTVLNQARQRHRSARAPDRAGTTRPARARRPRRSCNASGATSRTLRACAICTCQPAAASWSRTQIEPLIISTHALTSVPKHEHELGKPVLIGRDRSLATITPALLSAQHAARRYAQSIPT